MRNFWQFKNLGKGKSELYLYGEIVSESPWFSEDCVSYRDFINDLKDLGECSDIAVYINSGGGDVFAANAIYSQLKKHAADITVEIEGICASAATIIAMAGDTIKAEKNSLIMIHNPSIGLMGYFDECTLDKYKNSVNAVKRSIIEAYLSKIDKTEEELSELMDNETWYTGKEAFENGIIDEVFENQEKDKYLNCAYDKFAVVNNFVCDIGKFKNFPKDKMKFENFNKSSENGALTEPFFNMQNCKQSLSAIHINEQDVKKADSCPTIKNKEEKVMTAEEIKEKYPDIYNSIGEEAMQKERERIKAIDEIADNLPEEMVCKAKYTDRITAESLAFKALKENKNLALNTLADIIEDNKKSGVKDVAAEDCFDEGDLDKKKRINSLVSFMNKGGTK